MKVSVIVPAYKVEAYLPACLESLRAEDLPDAEFLVVDDGSPDGCRAIAEDFARRDSRFRVLPKENGGLSDARNYGLDRARGDAVFFLDGDDSVLPGALPRMLAVWEESGADLVLCDALCAWEDGRTRTVSSGLTGAVRGEETKPLLTRLYPVAWNKLIRREILEREGLRFLKGVWFEDVDFTHRLFPYADKIVAPGFAGVRYRQRAGSITAKADPKLFDYLTVTAHFCDWYRDRGLLPAWEKEVAFCASRYLLATFCKRAARLPGDLPEKAAAGSLAFLDERFPNWRKNPYMTGAKGFYLKHFSANWMPILRSVT